MITGEDVRGAARTLEGQVNRTPVLRCRALDDLSGGIVLLKCECLQRSGSFKIRGAYNKVASLSLDELERGVVAFSSGNHGAAVALAARIRGARAEILVPDDSPEFKLRRIEGYGGHVHRYDRQTEDREALGAALVRDRGLTLVHPFDDPLVAAGQGTVALELLADEGALDMVLLPIGGGGLAAGCATIVEDMSPGTQIVGVEPAGANDTQQSLETGTRVEIALPSTIADALRATRPGSLTFAVNNRLLNSVITVTEDEIRTAMVFLFEWVKVVVEPSAAVAVGAILAEKIDVSSKRVGLVISGGNIDVPSYAATTLEVTPR